MPKCLFRYQWVKLPRTHLPVGKGIMGYWAKLASRAAFRKGRAKYCGYTNDVMPGMWSGGVVGLKSILGVKSRTEALEIMNTLSRFGYIRYTLNEKTKKLEYAVTDWVVKCSGAECMSGTVYATDGYGFLCLPRNITQRLADQRYTFGESDAWLDLWCHKRIIPLGKMRGYAFRVRILKSLPGMAMRSMRVYGRKVPMQFHDSIDA